MNYMFFPRKQTSKPEIFLENKHTKLKNKIINLKAPLSQTPTKSSNPKAIKYQINPKIQHANPNKKSQTQPPPPQIK